MVKKTTLLIFSLFLTYSIYCEPLLYRVKEGDSLQTLAIQFSVPQRVIHVLNFKSYDPYPVLREGDLILIPIDKDSSSLKAINDDSLKLLNEGERLDLLPSNTTLITEEEIPYVRSEIFQMTDKDGNPFSEDNPMSVLLIGDSLALGARRGLNELVPMYADMTFYDEGRVSTGIGRSDFFDWAERANALADWGDWDVVLIFIGANDAQPLYGWGDYHQWGSYAWLTLYEERMKRMIEGFIENDTIVYWMELPPMGRELYRDSIVELNEIQRGFAEAYGAQYMETIPYLGDNDGLYTPYKSLTHDTVTVREVDTIHITWAGSYYLAGMVIDRLRKDFYFE